VSANPPPRTVVAHRPPLRVRPRPPLPPHARDLASGNPDPALLPPLAPPGIRITTTTLEPAHAAKLAAAIHETTNAPPAGFLG
jgi:hypothetical protein